MAGELRLTLDSVEHTLSPGGYAYVAPATRWAVANAGDAPASFHWIRKAYQPADGISRPECFVTSDHDVEPVPMPDTDGAWATTRFVDSGDMRHDMHVNIVTFQPGGSIPFAETHVMEHGLYVLVLEGKAVYRLNQDWVEVEAGDYMWLRAFCPQACYAGGPGPFRYHATLTALQGCEPRPILSCGSKPAFALTFFPGLSLVPFADLVMFFVFRSSMTTVWAFPATRLLT